MPREGWTCDRKKGDAFKQFITSLTKWLIAIILNGLIFNALTLLIYDTRTWSSQFLQMFLYFSHVSISNMVGFRKHLISQIILWTERSSWVHGICLIINWVYEIFWCCHKWWINRNLKHWKHTNWAVYFRLVVKKTSIWIWFSNASTTKIYSHRYPCCAVCIHHGHYICMSALGCNK